MNTADFRYVNTGSLELLTCNAFSAFPFLRHGFTTRTGGASTGGCSSLNFSWKRKDSAENVQENHRRLANAMGFLPEDFVFVEQTHSDRIFVADATHRNKGSWWQNAPSPYDAVITRDKGTALIARVADCIPVLLLDPTLPAVAAVHSGWRSTAAKIIEKAVLSMQETFGCRPENILAAVGPCIGPACFAVGQEVADIFAQSFGGRQYEREVNGQRTVDLWACAADQLKNAGLAQENIHMAKICTHCQPEKYFSHRRDKGETGAMLAVIELC